MVDESIKQYSSGGDLNPQEIAEYEEVLHTGEDDDQRKYEPVQSVSPPLAKRKASRLASVKSKSSKK